MRSDANRAFQIYGAVLVFAGIALLYFLAVSRTQGLFVYALDDAYIHLALAENIAQGHYGINPDETASPSSSIIYPLLLVPSLGFGHLAPLILATIGALGAAWLLSGLVWRSYAAGPTAPGIWEPALVLAAMLLCANLFGLPFTGMEHTLHVWASLAVLVGLIDVANGKNVSWSLLLGLVACPLLRFEGVALTSLALITLASFGHWRSSLITLIVLVLIFVGYGVLMSSLGLPVLPSSVLTKHAATAAILDEGAGNPLAWVIVDLIRSLKEAKAAQLAMGFTLLMIAAARVAKTQGPLAGIWLCIAGATGAHILFGQYGWFSRYEIYIVATCLAAMLYAYRDFFSSDIALKPLRAVGITIGLLVIGSPYAYSTALTPSASENIYAQHYQMHRFSKNFFIGGVAANDIGYVAYNNPSYLLDLWGLGSEAARLAAGDGVRSPDEIGKLTQDRAIDYAMVFDEWFPDGLPPDWCRMAILATPKVISEHAEVSFYLINKSREAEFVAALEAFSDALPEVSSLSLQPDCNHN